MKKCRICLAIKPDDEFPEVIRRSKDASDHVCIVCAQKKGLLSGLKWMEEANKTEKICPRCRQIKPASAFRICANTNDGLTNYCIDCTRLFSKEQYRKRKLHAAKN